MSFLAGRPWLRRAGLAIVAAAGLAGAMTTTSKPAEARVWVSVGIPFGGYYAPPPYYYRPYYRPYYRAYYPRHHRHWCYYHPYRCGW